MLLHSLDTCTRGVTHITIIIIFLESMLTEHGTHDLWTGITFTDVTVIVIFLESMFTIPHAHHFWTFGFLIASANLEQQICTKGSAS